MDAKLSLHTQTVFSALDANLRSSYERLSAVLKPPLDAPNFCQAILTARDCCNAWLNSLPLQPQSASTIVSAIYQVSQLAFEAAGSLPTDGAPLFRRLSTYPAWAMLLAIHDSECQRQEILTGIGAAITLSMATGRSLPKSLCVAVRRWLMATHEKTIPQTLLAELARSKKRASKYFLGASMNEETGLDSELMRHYQNRNFFASERTHQGLADHRAQSAHQMRSSAASIKAGVLQGNHDDILAAISFCCGLPIRLAARLPVGNQVVDWPARVDIERGCFQIRMGILTPEAASPSSAGESALIASTDVMTRPMPRFLQEALANISRSYPGRKFLGELLPQASRSSYRLLGECRKVGAIRPTYARFLNGAGAFADEAGLSRQLAAIASGDFRLIPRGRLYYVATDPSQMHAACRTYYSALGWGEPVSLEHDASFGSQVVPKDETIQVWNTWMHEQVQQSQPGKHSSLSRIVQHHNLFAMATLSIAVFTLFLRGRSVIQILAADVSADLEFVAVGDKCVGQHYGKDLIPACWLLQQQLNLYLAHLEALDNRLKNLGLAETCPSREHLREVLEHGPIHLFFSLEKLRPSPLGSAELTSWWPGEFQLAKNFGRHYWQSRFEMLGIRNLELDASVRHSQRGNLAWSAGSMLAVDSWARKVREAMNSKIFGLGLAPIPGLTKARRK